MSLRPRIAPPVNDNGVFYVSQAYVHHKLVRKFCDMMGLFYVPDEATFLNNAAHAASEKTSDLQFYFFIHTYDDNVLNNIRLHVFHTASTLFRNTPFAKFKFSNIIQKMPTLHFVDCVAFINATIFPTSLPLPPPGMVDAPLLSSTPLTEDVELLDMFAHMRDSFPLIASQLPLFPLPFLTTNEDGLAVPHSAMSSLCSPTSASAAAFYCRHPDTPAALRCVLSDQLNAALQDPSSPVPVVRSRSRARPEVSRVLDRATKLLDHAQHQLHHYTHTDSAEYDPVIAAAAALPLPVVQQDLIANAAESLALAATTRPDTLRSLVCLADFPSSWAWATWSNVCLDYSLQGNHLADAPVATDPLGSAHGDVLPLTTSRIDPFSPVVTIINMRTYAIERRVVRPQTGAGVLRALVESTRTLLRDRVVVTTGLGVSSIDNHISLLVGMCGGQLRPEMSLTKTSYLIAVNTSSAKFTTAADKGITIVSPAFLPTLVRCVPFTPQHEAIHAAQQRCVGRVDAMFSLRAVEAACRFRGLLQGVTVCCSGFSADAVAAISAFVEEQGGTFEAALTRECNVLVVNGVVTGMKCKVCLELDIPVVFERWLWDVEATWGQNVSPSALERYRQRQMGVVDSEHSQCTSEEGHAHTSSLTSVPLLAPQTAAAVTRDPVSVVDPPRPPASTSAPWLSAETGTASAHEESFDAGSHDDSGTDGGLGERPTHVQTQPMASSSMRAKATPHGAVTNRPGASPLRAHSETFDIARGTVSTTHVRARSVVPHASTNPNGARPQHPPTVAPFAKDLALSRSALDMTVELYYADDNERTRFLAGWGDESSRNRGLGMSGQVSRALACVLAYFGVHEEEAVRVHESRGSMLWAREMTRTGSLVDTEEPPARLLNCVRLTTEQVAGTQPALLSGLFALADALYRADGGVPDVFARMSTAATACQTCPVFFVSLEATGTIQPTERPRERLARVMWSGGLFLTELETRWLQALGFSGAVVQLPMLLEGPTVASLLTRRWWNELMGSVGASASGDNSSFVPAPLLSAGVGGDTFADVAWQNRLLLAHATTGLPLPPVPTSSLLASPTHLDPAQYQHHSLTGASITLPMPTPARLWHATHVRLMPIQEETQVKATQALQASDSAMFNMFNVFSVVGEGATDNVSEPDSGTLAEGFGDADDNPIQDYSPTHVGAPSHDAKVTSVPGTTRGVHSSRSMVVKDQVALVEACKPCFHAAAAVHPSLTTITRRWEVYYDYDAFPLRWGNAVDTAFALWRLRSWMRACETQDWDVSSGLPRVLSEATPLSMQTPTSVEDKVCADLFLPPPTVVFMEERLRSHSLCSVRLLITSGFTPLTLRLLVSLCRRQGAMRVPEFPSYGAGLTHIVTPSLTHLQLWVLSSLLSGCYDLGSLVGDDYTATQQKVLMFLRISGITASTPSQAMTSQGVILEEAAIISSTGALARAQTYNPLLHEVGRGAAAVAGATAFASGVPVPHMVLAIAERLVQIQSVVTPDWLFACAFAGREVPCEPFRLNVDGRTQRDLDTADVAADVDDSRAAGVRVELTDAGVAIKSDVVNLKDDIGFSAVRSRPASPIASGGLWTHVRAREADAMRPVLTVPDAHIVQHAHTEAENITSDAICAPTLTLDEPDSDVERDLFAGMDMDAVIDVSAGQRVSTPAHASPRPTDPVGIALSRTCAPKNTGPQEATVGKAAYVAVAEDQEEEDDYNYDCGALSLGAVGDTTGLSLGTCGDGLAGGDALDTLGIFGISTAGAVQSLPVAPHDEFSDAHGSREFVSPTESARDIRPELAPQPTSGCRSNTVPTVLADGPPVAGSTSADYTSFDSFAPELEAMRRQGSQCDVSYAISARGGTLASVAQRHHQFADAVPRAPEFQPPAAPVATSPHVEHVASPIARTFASSGVDACPALVATSRRSLPHSALRAAPTAATVATVSRPSYPTIVPGSAAIVPQPTFSSLPNASDVSSPTAFSAPADATTSAGGRLQQRVGTGRLFENVVFAVVLHDLQEEMAVKRLVQELGGVLAPADTARRVLKGAPPFPHPVFSTATGKGGRPLTFTPDQFPSSVLGYTLLKQPVPHPSVVRTGVHIVITRECDEHTRDWFALAPLEGGGGSYPTQTSFLTSLQALCDSSVGESSSASAFACAVAQQGVGVRDYFGDGHVDPIRTARAEGLLKSSHVTVEGDSLQASLFGRGTLNTVGDDTEDVGDMAPLRPVRDGRGHILSPDGIHLDLGPAVSPPWLMRPATHELPAMRTFVQVMHAAFAFFEEHDSYYARGYTSGLARRSQYVSVAGAARDAGCFPAYMCDSAYSCVGMLIASPMWLNTCKELNKVLDPRRSIISQTYVDMRAPFVETFLAACAGRPPPPGRATTMPTDGSMLSSRDEKALMYAHMRAQDLSFALTGLSSRLALLTAVQHRMPNLALALRSHQLFAPIVDAYNSYTRAVGRAHDRLEPVPAFLVAAAELACTDRACPQLAMLYIASRASTRPYYLARTPNCVSVEAYMALPPGVYRAQLGSVAMLVLDPHSGPPAKRPRLAHVSGEGRTHGCAVADEPPLLPAVLERYAKRLPAPPGVSVLATTPAAPAGLTREASRAAVTTSSLFSDAQMLGVRAAAQTLLSFSPHAGNAPLTPPCFPFYVPIATMPWLRVPYSARYLDGQCARGWRVCLSGFKSVERRRLVELLELVAAQRAAVVADGFDRECVLLVAAGVSEKVNKAHEWGIPVVSVHWVVESLRAGGPLEESFFPL